MPYKEKEIKQKYFDINEVAKLTKIRNTSKIRYWGREMDRVIEKRKRKGSRMFTIKDIKTIATIKFMIKEGYTLEGVRKNFSKYKCNEEFKVKRIKL
ncbi:hypothetical protein LCGC14_0246220 [marine sediment metagenome]|uniref:HTH merR-type domain-containing protein n=1 Tax=marine sediment metagenome TaxID=412755 RepID=A0A0F9WR61_9ZZZZ